MPRIVYAKLADALRELDASATCGDLSMVLESFFQYDPEYLRRSLAVLDSLPSDTEWMQGLIKLCGFLREDDPRFSAEIFMDEMVLNGR